MASVEIMLRFKEKDRDKKKQKSGFHCGMDEVSAELSSTEDNPRENNCRKRVPSQVRQTSFLRQSTQLLVSFTKKVYDIIQIEVSRKNLDSSASVASTGFIDDRNSAGEERDKLFYTFGGAAPNQVINRENKHRHWMGRKGRANLSERKMKTGTVHFYGLKNEG